MEDKVLRKEVEDFKITDDLDLFFNDFIKKGIITREDEVVPGFKVKLKVLNTGELLSAESIMIMTQGIPYDIVQKVRCASILSQAILTVNGIDVDKEDLSKEQLMERRRGLYSSLLDMPAYVIQKTYDIYIDAVKEQNRLYSSKEELGNSIENF